MRPENLNTKIFLDSGSAEDTEDALSKLGFLDGQTTNPSYFAKGHEVQERLAKGGKFSQTEVYEFYKDIVQKISKQIPDGSVSIEVYADAQTTAEQMLAQGKEMYTWIPNAHIKFPTIHEGLKAAEMAVKEGMRVNMTVVFIQEQAAAVYAATKGAKRGQVYVSPFAGRWYDKGIDGLGFILNIIKMYQGQGDGHVMVLGASMRKIEHVLSLISRGCDIITIGKKYLEEWHELGMTVPDENYELPKDKVEPVEYKDIPLDKPWTEYKINDEMVDGALQSFIEDWNKLIK